MKRQITVIAFAALLATPFAHAAQTIRVAIGTQDTTINCATGGLLIRELKLLEKYLPQDGKYKDVTYDIQWKNFTSGAPLTNEMVAGKLDIGSMADFPGSNNGAAFIAAGRQSLFITVLSGSTQGSGNGIVVPKQSGITALSELRVERSRCPFASTAHGMLLRAVAAQGWDPQKDVNIITQAPEVAGPALQANKIEAHADFVPFAELFEHRGIARKIYRRFAGQRSDVPRLAGRRRLCEEVSRDRGRVPARSDRGRPAVRGRSGEVQRTDREGHRHRGRGQLPLPRSARPADPRPHVEAASTARR